jgi:ATP synthase in type III secretion protein N
MMNEIVTLVDDFSDNFNYKIKLLEKLLDNVELYQKFGYLISAVGCVITAKMSDVKIGDLCEIGVDFQLKAEVIAIDGDNVKLLPYGDLKNISQNMPVRKVNSGFKIYIGDSILGKVIDGFGHVIGSLTDSQDFEILDGQYFDINCPAPDPMKRPIISDKLITGVKAIDLFNTCAIGQRIGIFASPGIGKTTLLGMMSRNTNADVRVICLIGERGREVREFIELELTKEIRETCVVVVATSDKPPVEQVKCAYVAQTIAEYFRCQGKDVVLFVDSITRFARAQREVGLSAGEPIARGGYPPSVFLSFPKLMERAGVDKSGSITAFYTVLVENEDIQKDPIGDEVKSIIDGHIVLSKTLAERGQFPAINLLTSLSRLADRVITDQHLNAARHIKLLLSKYQELEFLIKVGEYKSGQDKISDEAIKKYEQISSFLKQGNREKVDFSASLDMLYKLQKS